MGKIEVLSEFGEKFEANIEVFDPDPNSVEINIGSPEDYGLLKVERSMVIDQLRIEKEKTEGEPTDVKFKVFSNRPLFYPSFNLIVRAEKDGGTLLENYLVAVDFDKGLRLAFRGKSQKKKDSLNEDSRKTAQSSSKDSRQSKTAPGVDAGNNEDSTRDNTTTVSNTELLEIVSREFPESEAIILEKPALKEAEKKETPAKPPIKGLAPKVDLVSRKNRLNKVLIKNLSPFLEHGTFGPITNGESLLKLSTRFKVPPDQAPLFSVALWMDNQDKFINENLHGLKQGQTLDLRRVEQRLASLNLETAEQLVQSQWQDWKKNPSDRESQALEQAVLLDKPTMPELVPRVPLDRVFDMLADWESSWEAEDLNRHLSHYSKKHRSTYNRTIKIKRRFFKRHENIQIRISDPVINGKDPYWSVSFRQSFRSNLMESVGFKIMDLTWSEQGWKILNETFKANRLMTRPKKGGQPQTPLEFTEPMKKTRFQYVLHLATLKDLSAVENKVRFLRQKGFEAYYSPVNNLDGQSVYHLFVGRFKNLETAEYHAKTLRRFSIARNALPMLYPHAFQVADVSDMNVVNKVLERFRRAGFSPYVLAYGGWNSTPLSYKVLLGAFDDKRDAFQLLSELEQKGLKVSWVTP